MADDSTRDFAARYAEIDARLDRALTPDERASAKAEIIVLFREIDQRIADLTALKDHVKRLADKWKAQQAVAPTIAPQFSAEKPVTRADHLGASTFVENGWSRLSMGDYDGAETALQRALELVPNDPQSEALLGWAQMLNEKYDLALSNFQKVLAREPQNALARINVGYICLKKKIFGEAIEHLARAIRSDTDKRAVLYAHFYMGLVYLEREMYTDAEAFLLKTLSLGPKLVEAHYELGRAYWFHGRHDDAREAWRQGALANKFSPWAARCTEMLESVEAGKAPQRT
jgi:tetratricopeptide (TPR) repeat protein